MVKRAGGALLLGVRIDHAAVRPVATQLYAALRELILAACAERWPARPTTGVDRADR